MTPNALLKKALLNPNAPDLLEEIRNRASEIIEALDAESEDANLFDIAVEDLDPAWTATILEALSNSEELPPEEQAIREMLVNATDAAEERIGHAFAEALFEDLPTYLTQFDHMLKEAKIALIDPELRAELLKTPSLQTANTWPEVARKAANALADRGMTPLTLFYTTEAVWEIIDRLMYYGDLSKDIPVVLRFEEDKLHTEPDPRLAEIILEETQVLCPCDVPTAKLLLGWVLQVAPYKPFIFRRFKATPTTTGLSLTPAEHDYEELFERWKIPAPLGARLKRYATHLKNDTVRRGEFRLALQGVYYGSTDTAEELIYMAHEYAWPPWAVTCLLDLCISLDKQPDESEVMLVWQTILSYMPDDFRYVKLETYCEGAIHKVNMPKETAGFIRRLADYIEPARGSHPFASEISLEGAISDVVYSFQLMAEMQGETVIAKAVGEKRKDILDEFMPKPRPVNSQELTDSLERAVSDNEAVLKELTQQPTSDKEATPTPETKFHGVVNKSSFDILNTTFQVEMDVDFLKQGLSNLIGIAVIYSAKQGRDVTVKISSRITEEGNFRISIRNEGVSPKPGESGAPEGQRQGILTTQLPKQDKKSTPFGFMEHFMKTHNGELNYIPVEESWSEINLTFPARKLAA